MDDSRRSTPSFADDLNEFDLLLEDDDFAQPAPRAKATGFGEDAPAASTATKAKGRSAGGRLRRTKAAPSGSTPSIRITPDWNRIAAVLFVGVVIFAVIYFATTNIMDARRNGAYSDYFKDVRDIAAQSTAQGTELESILDDPEAGDRAQRVQRIEQLATRARKLSAAARDIDVPDQLDAAHAALIMSLDYRATGLASLNRAISNASTGSSNATAVKAVAGAMSRLVASDVVWADSFAAASRQVLDADNVEDVTVPDSSIVKDLDSIGPTEIGKMLTRLRTAGTKTATGAVAVPNDGKTRGGQLEAGRITVAPSGQTLSLDSLNNIKGGDSVVFEVPFTNQGEVQLTNVPVTITLRGEGSDPIELTGTIDTVDPGQTATARVPLSDTPTFGEVLTMDVLAGPIPGEKKTDNNRASLQAQFSL